MGDINSSQINMRKQFRLFLHDRMHSYSFYSSVMVLSLGCLIFMIQLRNLPPVLPLFYNRPWGEDQLAQPLSLFIFLFFGIILFLGNTYISLVVSAKNILLSRLIMWVSVLSSLLLVITIIRIIILVT